MFLTDGWCPEETDVNKPSTAIKEWKYCL